MLSDWLAKAPAVSGKGGGSPSLASRRLCFCDVLMKSKGEAREITESLEVAIRGRQLAEKP